MYAFYILYSGKAWWGKSLANLTMIHQTKTIQISTYNNLLADVLIRQTFLLNAQKESIRQTFLLYGTYMTI